MQRMGKVFIPLAIAFALLFALNVSGFAQATVPSLGTVTNPGTHLPAQNPAGSYQPGIGSTTPNSIPAEPPNTNPNITPNLNVIPNSTFPNQNPNMVPNPYPNIPNVPYPNTNLSTYPRATNPHVTPDTEPNTSNSENPIPHSTVPGIGTGGVGTGVPRP